jgi:tRNA pseudouridine65 synthase
VRSKADGFWASLPFGPGVRRVALDGNGLAALDKPEGVLSHPNTPKDHERSLVRAHYDARQECYEWSSASGEKRSLWLINRLDSATSGLILAATSAQLAQDVRDQFKRRQVRKVYQALVFGKPRVPTETWKDMLEVSKKAGKIRTAVGTGRLPAESVMTLERAGIGTPRVSLIRLEPHTGRSHQLRAQCAKRHLPIVGDQTYGDFPANRIFSRAGGPKRLYLHSLETSFDYTYCGREYAFAATAPLPGEFIGFD